MGLGLEFYPRALILTLTLILTPTQPQSGGDAGLPELCLMLLDWYAHTLDDAGMARYLPLLSGTLAFFALHYGDVASLQPNATLRVFPTQVPNPHPDPHLLTCLWRWKRGW